ncbi:MAG: NAD-dependent epimerase/dehydratase family protein [Vicinamibacterales bacterium]
MDPKKATIIVTGSSGVIGSPLSTMLGKTYNAVGFDRAGSPYPPIEVECVPVDLTSDDRIRRALERVRYAYGPRLASVIHLAAYYDFSGEPSPLYDEITVRGTERLLRALHGMQFDVEQFIFSSTMLLHAPSGPGERISEDSPVEPTWDYPRSKVEAERVIKAERGAIPSVMLRIAGVYDDECHSIPLAHQIQRIYERRLTARVYPGDVSRGQAFVHLDDTLEAIRLTVEKRHELPPVTTLLIGEPVTLSYDELQRTFARLIHGEEWETHQIPKSIAKTGAWMLDNMPLVEDPFIKPWMVDLADDDYSLNIGRARETLGWEPKHSLRDTLPGMVAALTRDPAAWYREHELRCLPSETS